VPQLGDGRAILLGEVVGRDGLRRDLQLKGSGRTPFSRRGDGRAALGPVLREYIVSEAMAALGVPTTRSLAAVATGEPVYRETALPGAVLTRVAASHVRVGTFQYFAAAGDAEAVRLLADHAIARPLPGGRGAENAYRALLDAVVARQAELVARWLLVGFVHGVMNTDNTSVAGETIDYGPCAFLDAYDPAAVFSSIDSFGRYAYGNQPRVAQWNLARLAETLLPLLGEDEERALAAAQEALAPSRRASRRPTSAACGARSACRRSAKATRSWPRTCWCAWRRTAPTSRCASAGCAMRRRRGRRPTRACAASSRTPAPTTPGRCAGASACPGSPSLPRRGRPPCGRRTRPSSRATTWWKRR
jgi:uncharacterized protein YdiU (UPF0061 family)